MDFSHLKLILSILIMILFIAPCFAKGARGFTITIPDFNLVYDDFFQYDGPNVYEASITDKSQEISENAKTDNLAQANQVLTATQPAEVVLNIDKAYFSFPHNFSFYIADTRKVTVPLGPYWRL